MAKADKATLNKLKRALNDRRKEIKAVYMAPYLHIEAQIKELTAMIDEPLDSIDAFVKDMEASEKAKKLEIIHEWYQQVAAPLGSLAEKVFNAPGFVDSRWLNKTTKTAEWQKSVRERIAKTVSDISAIQTAAGEHSTAVLTKYLDGMDIKAATGFMRELESTAKATTDVSQIESDDNVVGYKVLRVSGTQRQMEQLLEQIALLGIDADEIEDGMPHPMAEIVVPDFDSFVAFDIETSGTFGAAYGDSPAEITEIGAVKVINGAVVDKFDMLCNPGRRIVPRIARLTHITDDMVSDAPPVSDIMRKFSDFVGNLPLVGHNIRSSDLHYIGRAAKRAGVLLENSFFDTYLYAKRFKEQQGWDNVKLETLSQHFGIKQNEAHRAWCDAEANVGVYFKLKEL